MTWRERIQRAKKRGAFFSTDRMLAASFGTCAVAEQRANGMPIQLRWDYPEDADLQRLGYDFARKAVDYDDFALAESLLDAIEDRALALKLEMFASSDEAPSQNATNGAAPTRKDAR